MCAAATTEEGRNADVFFSLYYHYQIIIRATHTQEVLGEKGRRIRELTSLVQKRFKVRSFSSPPLPCLPLARSSPSFFCSLFFSYSSPRTPSSSTPRRSRTEDFPPSLRPSPFDTSSSVDLPSDEPATESFDSSWSPELRDARSSSPVSCELPGPRP